MNKKDVTDFQHFLFSLFHVLSLIYPQAAIRMCPSGQIEITLCNADENTCHLSSPHCVAGASLVC